MQGSFRNYGKIDPYLQFQYETKRKERRRIFVIVGASVFLALVVVCVVVGVAVSSKSHSGNGSDDSPQLQSGASAIQAACNTTRYPDTCVENFDDHPESLTANPLQLVTLGVRIALSKVSEAYSLSLELSRQANLDPREQMALEDCSDLLGNVMDYLNSSVVALNNLDVRSLQNSLKEIEILLSTASSEQTACTDGFYNITGNSRNSMLLKQDDVDKVLINAICLVETLSTLGPNLSSWKDVVPQVHLRRLLSTDDGDDDTMVGHLVARMERRLQEFNSSSNPDAVVAQDGTGRYATLKEALDAVPEDRSGRYVIYIKAGIYNEGPLNISKDLKDITLIGDGCNKTIITGNANVALLNYTTYRSATLGVLGDGFQARYITFRNTAGPYGHQAVALRINAKTAVLESCCFEGYQDTLYPLSGEQFYKNCTILGTVDFIFGNALAVFQNCELGARLPTLGQSNTYTAQARKDDAQLTGFAFQNCSLTQGDDLKSAPYAVSTYLGRPWKTYSTVVFLQSYMGPHIHPDGWMSWNLSRPFESTCFYGEYANTGPGSNIASRVNWKGVHPSLSESEASQYTVSTFFPDTAFIPTDVTYKASL